MGDDGSHGGPIGQGPAALGYTRVVLRPIGTPLPLGFFAFGVGTMVLTSYELTWLPPSSGHQLGLMMLAFVAPLELFAALASFLARDAGAGTSLGIFGSVWLVVGLFFLGAAPGARSQAVGVFLFIVSAYLLILAVPSVLGRPLLSFLITLAVARYVLTGLFELTGSSSVERASGWLGVAIAAFSLYSGLAFLFEEAKHRMVLPMGRRANARQALEGGLAEQLTGAEHEAGVRQQL